MNALNNGNQSSRDRIKEITLDPKSLANANVNTEHEREVAIFDIIDGNVFAVNGIDAGPYKVHLALQEGRLVMSIGNDETADVAQHTLSLTPLKRIMKDYFLVCESYYDAVRTAPPARIQAIDVSRKSLHDEGSQVFKEELGQAITVDADTARRLFTLVCALHWKG